MSSSITFFSLLLIIIVSHPIEDPFPTPTLASHISSKLDWILVCRDDKRDEYIRIYIYIYIYTYTHKYIHLVDIVVLKIF